MTTHFESGDDAVTTHRAFMRFCDDIICARRPVQCSAGLVEPALPGAAAVLCSLIARLPVLSHSGVIQ